MFVLSVQGSPEPGHYRLAHYTCLVNAIVESGVDIGEAEDVRDVTPRALGLLTLGTTDEPLWQSLTMPCRFCGQGDTERTR